MRNDLFFETLSAFNDKGDNTETIAKCDEILKAEPKNRQALQLKAEAALKLKKMPAYTTALNCTKKILNENNNDIDIIILHVEALRGLDKNKEAELWLRKAEDLAPDNPDILKERSSLLIEQKRMGEAEKYLKELEKIYPEKAYNNLGVIAWYTKSHDDALSYFTSRLKFEPNDPTTTRNKCWLLYELKRYNEAISIIKKFIDDFGEINYQMYRILATLYLKIAKDFDQECYREFNNQPTEAGELILDESDKRWNDPKFQNTRKRTEYLKKSKEAFELVEEKNIQNPLSKYWEAVLYITLEDYERALTAIDDCLQEEQNWNILSYKAYVLKRQLKYDEAIKLADQILKDDPLDNIALNTKIDSLYWSGDLLEYRRLYLKYFENQKNEPKLPGQTKTLEEISEISIIPGENFDNEMLVIELLSSLKQNIWILDPYFSQKWFSWIRQALEQNKEIHEIRILMDLNSLKSAREPEERLEDLRKKIKKFNIQHKDSISMTFAINMNPSSIHDRFLFSQNDVWNIASADTIAKGDRCDLQKLSNPKTIEKDFKRFEMLWTNENYKITGGNDDYNKLKGLLKTSDN